MTPLRLIRVSHVVAFIVCAAVTLGAQAPAPATAAQAPTGKIRVGLTAGRSVVVAPEFEITRIAVTNPAVADAVVVQPREILIDGKSPGTVSLIVWGLTQRAEYDVVVDPGVSPLQQQLQLIFPGENIQANQTTDAVILTGNASNNGVMLRAGEIAEAISPKTRILNLLQVAGGISSQQVMLQVRIAEVNRRALTELGATMFTGPQGYKDNIMRSTTQQFPGPSFDNIQRTTTGDQVTNVSGDITFGDYLNLFVFNTQANLGILIKALQQTGYFQSLAEPNLIAYNGQEASFLAGGEVPIPVVQGISGSVSVEYKEFGVRLAFRPTIAGDVIRLKVSPEVSTLDFTNGLSLGGFRIPAINVRRASTDVELRDGQSFAIAGLMNNLSQDTRSAVPWLSKVPIIGNLFKSKATQQEKTELMVIVTPRLVRALNPDEVPPLPTLDEKFMPNIDPSQASRSNAKPDAK